MLLSWDGFDTSYDDPSTWLPCNGEGDVEDDEPQDGIFSLVERRTQAAMDMSFTGVNHDVSNDGEVDIDFEARRKALIEHFKQQYLRKEIIWHQNSTDRSSNVLTGL